MSVKKNILFVNPGHIRSLTDTYMYCKILNTRYQVTYIGFREHSNNDYIKNVNIIYLEGNSKGLINKIKYFKKVYELTKNKFDFVSINYFFGSFLLRFFINKNINLDIRSSYISSNPYKRLVFNYILRFESLFFKNISVIDSNVAKFLKLPNRYKILPLGAYNFFDSVDYIPFRVLYVGTLYNRNILKTVYAFSEFVKQNNINKDNYYTIIGSGSIKDDLEIKEAIVSLNMTEHIIFKGRLPYDELGNYFNSHSIGLSYIPVNNYFNFQPPTKTFEYLLNGLIVIATDTQANKSIVNFENGILVSDDVFELKSGFEKLYNTFSEYDRKKIKNISKQYDWKNIIDQFLIPIIENND